MNLGVMIGAAELSELEPAIQAAVDAGYGTCQINLFQTGWNEARIDQIAALLERFALPAAAIGCYMNPLKPDDPSLMGANLDDLKAVMRHGARLGAKKIVIWSGTYADDLLADHPENQTESALQHIFDLFTEEIIPLTQSGGWQILIEPWHTHALGSEERLLSFILRFPPELRAHLGVVLDAPNLMPPNRYARRDQEVPTIVQSLAPVTGLAHLKDIVYDERGRLDLPAPGKGALDYGGYLNALRSHLPSEIPCIAEHMPPSQFASVKQFLDSLG